MKSLVMMALALAMTTLFAEDPTKESGLTTEEQAFSTQLGETTRQAFHFMTAELRQAVLALMKDPALTADAAVEQVMKDHPSSSIKVEVKSN